MNKELTIERIKKYSEDNFNFLKNNFPGIEWSEKNSKVFLSDSKNILLIAKRGKIACGLIRAHILPRYDSKGFEALLHEIDVLPECRRQGVALALTEGLKKLTKSLGGSEIWVLTEESNKAAMGLYKKVGMIRSNPDDVMLSIDL